MPRQPSRRPTAPQLRRLTAALRDAQETMQDVAAVLDVTNIGRCKFRLIRASDRAATALRETQE